MLGRVILALSCVVLCFTRVVSCCTHVVSCCLVLYSCCVVLASVVTRVVLVLCRVVWCYFVLARAATRVDFYTRSIEYCLLRQKLLDLLFVIFNRWTETSEFYLIWELMLSIDEPKLLEFYRIWKSISIIKTFGKSFARK